MVLVDSEARERRQDEPLDSLRNRRQPLTTVAAIPVQSDTDAARNRFSATEPPIPTRTLHDAPNTGSDEATLRLAIVECNFAVDRVDFVHADNPTTALINGTRSDGRDYEESSYSDSMV